MLYVEKDEETEKQTCEDTKYYGRLTLNIELNNRIVNSNFDR